MKRIEQINRVRNEEVLNGMNENKTLLETIIKKKGNWIRLY